MEKTRFIAAMICGFIVLEILSLAAGIGLATMVAGLR